MKDKFMDAAIRRSLETRDGGRGPACPDENLVAAWLDGGLTPEEAGRLENHAAGCGYCRKVIALAAASEEEEAPVRAATPRAGYAGIGLSRTRVLALAAALSIVVAGAVFYRMSRQASLESGAVQLAEFKRDVQFLERVGDSRMAQPEATPPAAPAVGEPEDKPALKIESLAGRKAPAVEGAAPAQDERLGAISTEKDLRVETGTRAREDAAAPAGIAGQPGFAAAGAVGEARKKEKAEPAEQKLAIPGAGGRGAMPARTVTAQAPAEALMEFRLVAGESPQDAIRTMVDSLKDKAGSDLARTAGDRRFYRTASHWVDSRCDPAAAINEIPEGSPELEDILRSIPGVADLRGSGVPVLVLWKEKNALLR